MMLSPTLPERRGINGNANSICFIQASLYDWRIMRGSEVLLSRSSSAISCPEGQRPILSCRLPPAKYFVHTTAIHSLRLRGGYQQELHPCYIIQEKPPRISAMAFALEAEPATAAALSFVMDEDAAAAATSLPSHSSFLAGFTCLADEFGLETPKSSPRGRSLPFANCIQSSTATADSSVQHFLLNPKP